MLKAAQAQLGSHLVGDAGHQVLVVGDQQDSALEVLEAGGQGVHGQHVQVRARLIL